MVDYYNPTLRVPRRASAHLSARRLPSQPDPTWRVHRPRTQQQSVSRSPSRQGPSRPTRFFVIPLSDGTRIRVSEQRLRTLPLAYQNAARALIPQGTERQSYPALPQAASRQLVVGVPTRGKRGHHATPLRQVGFLLLFVSIVLALTIALQMALPLITPWLDTELDDLRYGRPRTFQIDAWVGHGNAKDPNSHFIAENLGGRAIVLEFPGDDPTHGRIYRGPFILGPDSALAPVTLSFADVNGDHLPDLIIHVGNKQVVFLNQKDGIFQPPKPAPKKSSK
jgi:hypothetical protein